MRGLMKLHHHCQKMAAWKDWFYLEEKFPEIAKPLRPPEGASTRKVDIAIHKVKVKLGNPPDWFIPSMG